MNSLKLNKILVIFIILSLLMSLVGCGANTTPSISDENEPSDNPEVTIPTDPDEPSDVSPIVDKIDDYGMTKQQRNSFSMLYYLAITAEEIRISKDNRLLLDEMYTSLLNDINPGAIDETTQIHLKNLRGIIEEYMNIAIKREQLQYIYNQDKASSIRNAVPNPLAVLSITNSMDWKKLAASAVYTIVDSYNNYKKSNETADNEFLMSGWELDAEENATIKKNRDESFDYMVDIVQEYKLPGELTLNEINIEKFAEICAIDVIQQKIHRLESEIDTYKLLGDYWLELANCYYETSQYRKCLDCIEMYNKLATGIYRKDYNYVQILPKAIVATQKLYEGDEYISKIKIFADDIMENTTTEEWSIRYFAAQVFLDLYARTNEKEFLKRAYDIAYDNVTILLDEQKKLNATYLAKVKEETIDEPDYRFMTDEEKKEAKKEYKDEQKRLKSYNKDLKETRKTELPPIYEPLTLNCDLLFALAEEMNISYTEKMEIEAILQTKTNGVFLSIPINNLYSFSRPINNYDIKLTSDKIVIPANLLSSDSKILIEVTENKTVTTIDDCIVTNVERKEEMIVSFYATIKSKKMKNYDWTENTKVTVKIINGNELKPLIFCYRVAEFDSNWILKDKVVFEKE